MPALVRNRVQYLVAHRACLAPDLEAINHVLPHLGRQDETSRGSAAGASGDNIPLVRFGYRRKYVVISQAFRKLVIEPGYLVVGYCTYRAKRVRSRGHGIGSGPVDRGRHMEKVSRRLHHDEVVARLELRGHLRGHIRDFVTAMEDCHTGFEMGQSISHRPQR